MRVREERAPGVTSIETYSGEFFDYLDPYAIDLGDIARALSYTARFGGHTERFYSVAEHALLVAKIAAHENATGPERLAALHHDDHEAYLGDLPTPLKRLMGEGYTRMANLIDREVADLIGLPDVSVFHSDAVKRADWLALCVEAHLLKPSGGKGPRWGFTEDDHKRATYYESLVPEYLWPAEAERRFLAAAGFSG